MKKILFIILMFYFVIWLKNGTAIFCTDFDMRKVVTYIYQQNALIAMTLNSEISSIEYINERNR